MKTDPIVEEIRKERLAHAERFHFDISAIAADYRELEKKYEKFIVSDNAGMEKNRRLTENHNRP